MSHSIEYVRRAEGSPRPLPFTKERCTLIIDLGPALWFRLPAGLPADLTLGLLTGASTAQRQNQKEFPDDGYARQPLKLGSERETRAIQAKHTVVSFGPLPVTGPTATHAAIFDADDDLLFFGDIYWAVLDANAGAVARWVEFGPLTSVH